ncbi:MAG: hypothetical protein JJT96_11730 [Opitutales bacterium]|nr:hypothetical protein [Opitutales bacterium]
MHRFSVLVSPPFQTSTFQKLLEESGKQPVELFVQLAGAVAERYFIQNGRRVDWLRLPEEKILSDIWEYSIKKGTPSPLSQSDMGKAGDPHSPVWSERTEELLQGWKLSPPLADFMTPLVHQLLLALLLPEFKACRQSYLEEEPLEGCIPRQEIDHCRERISGSHCEDCPYFTALSSDKHRKLLERSWKKGPAAFAKEADVFLPDDFRYLRVFIHLHRRYAP